MAKSVLEIDEISGDWVIRIPEDTLYELGWDEDQSVKLRVVPDEYDNWVLEVEAI